MNKNVYRHNPIYYHSKNAPLMGFNQKCGCGNIVRNCEHGVDYCASTKICDECSSTVHCGEIIMLDRFSGLDCIMAENRLQGVPGYDRAWLPTPWNFESLGDEEFSWDDDDFYL